LWTHGDRLCLDRLVAGTPEAVLRRVPTHEAGAGAPLGAAAGRTILLFGPFV